jgi:hypothetical protein
LKLPENDDRQNRLSWLQTLKSLEDLLWPSLADVNTNVRIKKLARIHYRPALLWQIISDFHIVGQTG